MHIRLFFTFQGRYNVSFDVDEDGKEPEILFTNNDTNMQKIFNQENKTPYTKDAFHRYLIQGHFKIK